MEVGNISQKQIAEIVKEVILKAESVKEPKKIRVEASGRHVHLSQSDAIQLFGTSELTPLKELSQPGQYLCKEKVNLIGPKGIFKDVAVLGPCRNETQVELSMTDARQIGLSCEVRDSGDIKGAEDVFITTKNQTIHAQSSAMVARRHIHMPTEDAIIMGLVDGNEVSVRVYGNRTITFENVLVRVSDRFSLSMHIDYDEANAVGLNQMSYGEIIKTY